MTHADRDRSEEPTDRCGFTVWVAGEEQPCDRPATGWRWYQGHEHEDALDVACDRHENEGGRRLHAAEAALARVEAVVTGKAGGFAQAIRAALWGDS